METFFVKMPLSYQTFEGINLFYSKLFSFSGLRRVQQNVRQRDQAEAALRHGAHRPQELRMQNVWPEVQGKVRSKKNNSKTLILGTSFPKIISSGPKRL